MQIRKRQLNDVRCETPSGTGHGDRSSYDRFGNITTIEKIVNIKYFSDFQRF